MGDDAAKDQLGAALSSSSILSIIIGAVFFSAGWIKALHTFPFILHVQNLRVLPKNLSGLIAILLIELECGMGMALMIGLYPSEILPIAMGMIIGLSLVTIFAKRRGRITNCGCYGGLINISINQSLLLNCFYFSALFIAYRSLPISSEQPLWKTQLCLIVILLTGMISKRSIRKPLLDFTLTRKNRSWRPDWLNEETYPLNSGHYMVLFLSSNCSECRHWLSHLEEINFLEKQLSPVVVMRAGDESTANWPVIQLKSFDFNRLVYRTPTAVEVKDGIIKERWVGTFPPKLI